MAKRLTQYEIDAILGQVVSEIEASKADLTKTPDVVKMEKKAKADRERLDKLQEQHNALKKEIIAEHEAFAKKKGLSFDNWNFSRTYPYDQWYTNDGTVNGDTKRKIKNKIILSGLKLENLDILIKDLVKEFSK